MGDRRSPKSPAPMNHRSRPSTDAPSLSEPASSARVTTANTAAPFRVSVASPRPGAKPVLLASQKIGVKPDPLASQKNEFSAGHEDRAKPATSTNKGGKLKITKTDGGYEFSTDAQTRFRARPESNKLRLMVRRKTESGEWPEMYVCMLDRLEWQTIRKGTLAGVLLLIERKLDERDAGGRSNPAKVAEVQNIIEGLKRSS